MKTAVMLLALTFATACYSIPGGGSADIRTLTSGGNAAVSPGEQQIEFASDAETYRRLWSQLVGTGEPPEVDFTRESVVFLLAGQRSTGGYSVEPRAARVEGQTLVVDAHVRTPGTDAMVTQALTSPYAVIAVRRENPFSSVRWGR